MLRKTYGLVNCLIFAFLAFPLISSAHTGDGSHQHCVNCGNAAHSGEGPSDENFFVGLGRTLIGEFVPGVSTADYLTD